MCNHAPNHYIHHDQLLCEAVKALTVCMYMYKVEISVKYFLFNINKQKTVQHTVHVHVHDRLTDFIKSPVLLLILYFHMCIHIHIVQ